jgi:small GTP-binding protein
MAAGTDAAQVPVFKVVFVGNESVGKTSIIMSYCGHDFSEDRLPTVGSGLVSREITAHSHKAVLQIWDTAGQERYRSLVPMYAKGADVAIVVFDVSNPQSFDDLSHWISQLDDGCQIVIAGNKYDLGFENSRDEYRHWAEANSFCLLFVSALTKYGIDELFIQVGQILPESAFRLRAGHEATIDLKDTGAYQNVCCKP